MTPTSRCGTAISGTGGSNRADLDIPDRLWNRGTVEIEFPKLDTWARLLLRAASRPRLSPVQVFCQNVYGFRSDGKRCFLEELPQEKSGDTPDVAGRAKVRGDGLPTPQS